MLNNEKFKLVTPSEDEANSLPDSVRKQGYKRLVALRDFGDVKQGDLGGFIASESNLSFEDGDNAWVYDNSIVGDSVVIKNNSVVRDGSTIRGSGEISGSFVGDGSKIGDSNVIDSEVRNVSFFLDAYEEELKLNEVVRSRVINSTLVSGSRVTDSHVDHYSNVVESTVDNSILFLSDLDKSTMTDSSSIADEGEINRVDMTNSRVKNSKLRGVRLDGLSYSSVEDSVIVSTGSDFYHMFGTNISNTDIKDSFVSAKDHPHLGALSRKENLDGRNIDQRIIRDDGNIGLTGDVELDEYTSSFLSQDDDGIITFPVGKSVDPSWDIDDWSDVVTFPPHEKVFPNPSLLNGSKDINIALTDNDLKGLDNTDTLKI